MDAPMIDDSEVVHNHKEKDDERQEREHFVRILNSFKAYRVFSLSRITDSLRHYDGLPNHHKQLIPHFLKHMETVQSCVEQNSRIIKLITQDAEHIFENQQNMSNAGEEEPDSKSTLPRLSDMEKVKSTLKQFVRDWSDQGQHERAVCYDPVIAEVVKRFPADNCETSQVNILVPGAGLGRLAFEFARRGYSCQGNEFSLFMLFSSNFVLNKCKEVNCHTLYPWVHQWTNNVRNADQTAPITFPDVDTSEIPEDASFSMAAGDFLEVYQDPEMFDCVATVFFIDTAHNIIAYVEKIYEILKTGGYWVNLGPLLYHYADMPNEVSIELAWEDVRNVIEKIGFVFEMEKLNVKSTYTQNTHSMLTYTYDSVMFVCRKPS
ncbi:carnosine N-methyltransferase-like [Dreissena polymorpha]|uniref:carnosine N-methyltransferase-like n=1 Tax=Dreissena polymorpha TaxID=45954 RepID=UPI002264DA2C|nr:carnosine N-methyltransferase-like [Dreissena polymorpha]